MKEADKKIKIIFTDLDGCPGIVMPFNIYEKLRDEFFHKNMSDYIKFDDFVHYMRQIPTSEGVINCCAFITWWSNHPTHKYYWPKREISICIETGYYSDIVKISGLTEVESIKKDLGATADRTNTITAYYCPTGDFDMELAKRQMKDLINGPYGILRSIADEHCNLVHIKDVIFNDPATIVFWSDGTKTVCTCSEQDTYDPEKGLALCVMKRVLYNNKGHIFNNAREKWLKKGAKKV